MPQLASSTRSKLARICRARWWAVTLVVGYQTRSMQPGPCKISFRTTSFFWRFQKCQSMAPSAPVIQSTIGSKMLVTNCRTTRRTRPSLSYLLSTTQPWLQISKLGRRKSCKISSSRLWTASPITASKRRILVFVSISPVFLHIIHLCFYWTCFYFNFIFATFIHFS